MLKLSAFLSLFLFCVSSYGQSLTAKKTIIKFSSVTEAEVIEAANEKAQTTLNTANGSITVSIKINGFVFENSLMEEHFLENYMESDKFPTATFNGTILNFSGLSLENEGEQNITIEGDLTMHGVTQKVSADGKLIKTGKKLSANCTFFVVPQDFGIKIPGGLNLAEKITVLVTADSFGSESSSASMTQTDAGKERITASYKNSKVINAQSLETTLKGIMDFRISHRFGYLNGGLYDLFGLDQASLRLSFDYGLTKRLMIGIGRSTYEKTYDGYLKYRILWQTAKSNQMPVSLIYYTNMSVNTLAFNNTSYERTFITRLNYVHQLILGRKFSEKITAQIMPTIVHRNFVLTNLEKNTVAVLGGAGRWKFTKRIALNAEYFFVLPDQLASSYTNSLSVGFDIETGGHVFQLHFTNSPIMIDKGYMTETSGKWLDGDINFGFNISRVFTIVKPKKPKAELTDK